MNLPRYATPTWISKNEMTVSANTVKRWAQEGHFKSPDGRDYAVWMDGKLFIRWREWVEYIDECAPPHQYFGAQSVPSGEKVCRIKGKGAHTGGLASRARAAKELDNLLALPTGVKPKQ